MAITMSNLNNRVSALEGATARTPITMKSLNDRITALENNPPRDCIVISVNKTLPCTISIDTKYNNYNLAILSCSGYYSESGGNKYNFSNSSITIYAQYSRMSMAKLDINVGISVTRSSGKITFSVSNNSYFNVHSVGNILLYKA